MIADPTSVERSTRLAKWTIRSEYGSDPALATLATCDVLVVGAGAAGVAAATCAAEAGLNVVLVERYGFAGGATVAGLSGTICGMYLASETSARPEQVVFGFAERFAAALRSRGGLTEPQRYGLTWTAAHDPLVWRMVADDLLTSAGVRVIFHAVVTGVLKNGNACEGVVIESNAGRAIVRAKRIIDASGDAAVVARAGGQTTLGDSGVVQNPTMIFRVGGVDLPRFRAAYGDDTICPPWLTEAIVIARGKDRLTLPRQKIWLFTTPHPNEILVNATRLAAHDGSALNVLDPEDFTYAEVEGRRQVQSYFDFLSAHVPGFESSWMTDTGTEAGVRQTRSIIGVDRLTNADVVEARKRTDGICRSPWPIELHAGSQPKLHWILDDFYDVPFGALLPDGLDDILVAGRCLSAEHEALASARVTAQCFEYGQAAAMAAVLSIREGIEPRDVPVDDIRAMMLANDSVI